MKNTAPRRYRISVQRPNRDGVSAVFGIDETGHRARLGIIYRYRNAPRWSTYSDFTSNVIGRFDTRRDAVAAIQSDHGIVLAGEVPA